MIWTEQRILALKNMWGRISARDIARELGEGVSRSAVIGKANRLKLSMGDMGARVTPPKERTHGLIKRVSSTRNAESCAATEATVARKASDKLAPVMNRAISGTPVGRQRMPLPPLQSLPMMSRSAILEPQLRNGSDEVARNGGMALANIGEQHCRWPIGDPRSPDFRFCGCNVSSSLPYCEEHIRVAYQGQTRKSRTENDIMREMRLSKLLG